MKAALIGVAVLVVAALIAALVVFVVHQHAVCDAKNGVIVRAKNGTFCIDKRVIR